MDEAGVDRALIHPVLWDPDSNELAAAAVRKHPDRFAIMGWFYLDDRTAATSSCTGRSGRAMLGLRFYTNERQPAILVYRRHPRLAVPAAERAHVPMALGAAMFLADGRQDRRAATPV